METKNREMKPLVYLRAGKGHDGVLHTLGDKYTHQGVRGLIKTETPYGESFGLVDQSGKLLFISGGTMAGRILSENFDALRTSIYDITFELVEIQSGEYAGTLANSILRITKTGDYHFGESVMEGFEEMAPKKGTLQTEVENETKVKNSMSHELSRTVPDIVLATQLPDTEVRRILRFLGETGQAYESEKGRYRLI